MQIIVALRVNATPSIQQKKKKKMQYHLKKPSKKKNINRVEDIHSL